MLERDDLDPLIRSRDFMLPLSANMIFGPSTKNIAYGDPFRGLVSDLYFWNRTLSVDEMTSFTTDCSYFPSMDDVILDWDKVGKGEDEEFNFEEVDKCESRLGTGEASVGLIPIRVPWKKADAACKAMGGRMANYDEEDFVQMRAAVDPDGGACGWLYWTPLQKVLGTSRIYNTITGDEVPFDSIPMQPGQPNGGDLQPCFALNINNAVELIWDDACDLKMCFACRFESLPKVTIHGDICPESGEIDRDYFLVTFTKEIYFRGFSGTRVQLVGENDKKFWKVKNFNNEIVGSVTGKPISPIGRGIWEFDNCPMGNNASSLKMTQVRINIVRTDLKFNLFYFISVFK